MLYRYLGNSGLKITEITYGNWLTHGSQVENDAAKACVRAALDAGITSFDTADAYANTVAEEVLGDALKGERRESLEIFTKVFWPIGPKGANDVGLSRKHVMESIDGSLRRTIRMGLSGMLPLAKLAEAVDNARLAASVAECGRPPLEFSAMAGSALLSFGESRDVLVALGGAVLTPLLLPWLPFRQLWLKGLVSALALVACAWPWRPFVTRARPLRLRSGC